MMSEFSDIPCKLCGHISNPDIHFGCDRANEEGCNWYVYVPTEDDMKFIEWLEKSLNLKYKNTNEKEV
jgi:predicted Fe-S protein YdhL (DUF1289 family)